MANKKEKEGKKIRKLSELTEKEKDILTTVVFILISIATGLILGHILYGIMYGGLY